jgi:peptidoglycan-associated lipoprotein
MSPHRIPPPTRLLPALFAMMIAGACSHEQSPPNPTPATIVAMPAPHSPATPPRSSGPAPLAAPVNVGKGDKELAVYFDFDSALLRDDARPILQKVANVAERRNASVRIEGNCDEVGTVEYNLALGEHRAIQAKDYLTRLGVRPSRIATVSYGSQRPKASGHDDVAHAQNRRDDLIVD